MLPWLMIIAPFVTFAVLFRRRLWLSLAIVAAPVGFIISLSSDAFGNQADRLGVYALVGFGGGALAGAFAGGLIELAWSGRPPDAADVAIAPAFLGGLAGMLLGGFVPALASGRPPDLTMQALLGIGVGGGLGWAAGAMIGRPRADDAPTASWFQRLLVVLAALWILAFGLSVIGALRGSGRFGPPMDHLTRGEKKLIPATTVVTAIDGVVAAWTLLTVAARRTRSRTVGGVL